MAPDSSIEMFLENNAKVIKTDNNSKNILRKIVHFGQLFVFSQRKSYPKNHFATICGDLRRIHELLEADGWFLCAIRGDHRQYKHATKKGKVTNIRNYDYGED